jgi:hypothetical protein
MFFLPSLLFMRYDPFEFFTPIALCCISLLCPRKDSDAEKAMREIWKMIKKHDLDK